MELSSPTFPALGQSPLASQAPELPYSYTGLIDLPLCHALLSIAAGCKALLADAGVQGSCPTLAELCCLCTLGLAWRFFFFFSRQEKVVLLLEPSWKQPPGVLLG